MTLHCLHCGREITLEEWLKSRKIPSAEKLSRCCGALIQENVKESFNKINEWLGFNYNDYKKETLSFIKEDNFDLVRAQNVVEKTAGKLTESQVSSLKNVLGEGFSKNQSINDMVRNVDIKVKPKDLYRIRNGKIIKSAGIPILARSADTRSINIVRSEVTRCANAGAINHFRAGGITRVRWAASYGARTCPECDGLNGNVYHIDNTPPIPLHSMCRCTFVAVTEPAKIKEPSWCNI